MSVPTYIDFVPAQSVRASAEKGAAADARTSPDRHAAWQRAMEEAQCRNWFRESMPDAAPSRARTKGSPRLPEAISPLVPSLISRAVSDSRTAEPFEPRVWRLDPSDGLPDGRAMTASGRERASSALLVPELLDTVDQCISSRSSSSTMPSVTTRRGGGVMPVTEMGRGAVGQPGSARPVTGGYLRTGTRGPEPMRVHAEWAEDGLRLWLGLDPDAPWSTAELSAQVLPALQRHLASHGAKLLAVICNGRVLWETPTALATSAVSRNDALPESKTIGRKDDVPQRHDDNSPTEEVSCR